MRLPTYILLSTLIVCSFCNGQTRPGIININTMNTVGDTVSTLSKNTWYVYEATNGDYWFGSDSNGVYRYDGRKIINYTTKHGLSSNRIRGIQEDKQGNLYFATLGGINKFNGHNIVTLTAIKSIAPGDNWKLQPDDLWFCTIGKNGEKGPYRYDGKNLYQLEFPKHYLADNYFRRFPNNAWSPYEVYYIYKDSKGILWSGTSHFGICRYDGKSFSWLYEDHLTNVPGGGSFGIRSILEDNKGKFWFCNTRYRFHISDSITHENGHPLIKYEKEKGIEGIKSIDGTGYIYFLSIAEDNKGNLWMATYNEGVWCFDRKGTIHYAVKDDGKDVKIITLYKDKKGKLWLGTAESGVYKFNGKTFEKFSP